MPTKSIALYDLNYDLEPSDGGYTSRAWKALMQAHQLDIAHPAIGWIQSLNPDSASPVTYTAVDKVTKAVVAGEAVTAAYAPLVSIPIFSMNRHWLAAISAVAAGKPANNPDDGKPLDDTTLRHYLTTTAKNIAQIVNDDPNAVGVMTDFEPPPAQPYRRLFHTTLAATLRNKRYGIWAGQETFRILPGTDDTLMLNEIAGCNTENFVVVPMYDRGSFPPDAITPSMYKAIVATQLGDGAATLNNARHFTGIGAGLKPSPWGGPFHHPSPVPGAYPNPMLPAPHSQGFLKRIEAAAIPIKLRVGLPCKCSTTEWLYRYGVLPGPAGSGAYYPSFMRNQGYAHLKSEVVQNTTATSMGDYVAPALAVIDSLRQTNKTWARQFDGVFVYGLGHPAAKTFEIKDDTGSRQAYRFGSDTDAHDNDIDMKALAVLDRWPG